MKLPGDRRSTAALAPGRPTRPRRSVGACMSFRGASGDMPGDRAPGRPGTSPRRCSPTGSPPGRPALPPPAARPGTSCASCRVQPGSPTLPPGSTGDATSQADQPPARRRPPPPRAPPAPRRGDRSLDPPLSAKFGSPAVGLGVTRGYLEGNGGERGRGGGCRRRRRRSRGRRWWRER